MVDTQSDPAALGDLDGLDQAASEIVALEDDLLAEFYAFSYEEAVLVGPNGSSSPGKPHSSPLKTRPPSPSRAGNRSPSKLEIEAGPNASHVAQATETPPEPPLSREIMNALLAPKTWRDENGKWQRMVRLTPATRQDVQRLQDVFALLLEEHQARASAICPVREKFFLQVFEELIRECACECPERGLLLLRLRDELRMTIEGYQTLYHSSIAYGRQKAVQAEAGISELETRVQQLQREQEQLRERRQQLTHRTLLMEAQVAEDEEKRELRQRQLVRFLEDQHRQLDTFLQALTQDTTWK